MINLLSNKQFNSGLFSTHVQHFYVLIAYHRIEKKNLKLAIIEGFSTCISYTCRTTFEQLTTPWKSFKTLCFLPLICCVSLFSSYYVVYFLLTNYSFLRQRANVSLRICLCTSLAVGFCII